MKILSLITGAVLLGGVVFGANYMSKNTSKKRTGPPGRETEDGRTADSAENRETGKAKPAQDRKPAARLVMQKEIMRFQDLLEPLYRISQKEFSLADSVATLDEWEQRLSGLEDADNLIRKWEATMHSYKDSTQDGVYSLAMRWLNVLASFEISRDDRSEVQVNEAVRRAYDSSGKEPLADGEYRIVKDAAWFKKSDVIRRGILVKRSINETDIQ